MKLLISILFLIGAYEVQAKGKKQQEMIPRFNVIGAEDQKGAMSMECKGTPPFTTLDCNFTQLYVRRKSEEDTKKDLAAVEKENFDINEFKTKTCSQIKTEEGKISKKISEDRVPERAIASRNAIAKFKAACECKDSTCLMDFAKKQVIEESKTCNVAANQFSARFKRVNATKWISNEGPTGLCDAVNVTTIERDKSSEYLWTFTQVRADADTSSDLCKGLELNKPTRYSWEFQAEFQLECPVIKFGVL